MSIQDALCFCGFILIAFFGIGCLILLAKAGDEMAQDEALKKVRGNNMRDQLKDKAIDLLKEAWAQGYEAGVKATNVDCGVVWEERIDAIKADIQNIFYPFEDGTGIVQEVLSIIDKHCGGDKG